MKNVDIQNTYKIRQGTREMWLWNLLLDDERECMYIETLDAVYKHR